MKLSTTSPRGIPRYRIPRDRSRSDGKRPNYITMTPFRNGTPLIWNFSSVTKKTGKSTKWNGNG